MLIRPITYTDFNDPPQTHTKNFHFHLAKHEFYELMLSVGPEGFEGWYKKAVADKDEASLYAMFKKIVLSSYGVRSEDGEEFDKSEEVRKKFEKHAAMHALFDEFLTEEKFINDFIRGALPKDFAAGLDDPEKRKEIEAEIEKLRGDRKIQEGENVVDVVATEV